VTNVIPFPFRSRSRASRPRRLENNADYQNGLFLHEYLARFASASGENRGLVCSWAAGRSANAAINALKTIRPTYENTSASYKTGLASLVRFWNLEHQSHAFYADIKPVDWLNLTERQATKALAGFLEEGGKDRVHAFLRALSPKVMDGLPGLEAIEKFQVHAELDGIDLLVVMDANNKRWGALVEAKFDHHAKSNPLAKYQKTAEEVCNMDFSKDELGRAKAVLCLVGLRKSALLAGRDAAEWDFIHWQGLLRRFEQELSAHEADDRFRLFRRILWERTQ
jgi:hypothetical protein